MVQRQLHVPVGSQQRVARHSSHEHVMNSELSPLRHVIPHMGGWSSQPYVHQVDVLNMKTVARVSDARAAAQRKESRVRHAEA